MEQKTFYQALIEFNDNPEKAKRSLNDKRLTLVEKKIVESHLCIRSNKNTEAIALLENLPSSQLHFVESQRLFVLGLAHNNLSHYEKGQDYLLQSLPELIKLQATYFIFLAYYDLYIVNSNLGNIEEMGKYLHLLKELPVIRENQKSRILKCEFDFYAETNNVPEALRVLAVINEMKNQLVDSDIISHLVCEFMFHVKQENFKECERTLQEMKSYRKFHLTENYNFMKKLLGNLTDNTPVYAYYNDFKNIPILYYQLKVIQCLESADRDEAGEYWERLKKMYPKDYQNNFEYTGSKNLFSLCLKKYINKKSEISLSDGTKLEQLVQILKNSDSPISKGLIYELIWDESPVNKEDYNKLTRMVYKAKNQYGLDIKTRKGAYFLETKKDKLKKIG